MPPWWPSGKGAWGCYQSHTNLIRSCIDQQLGDVLIFEDDAVLRENFLKPMYKFIETLPEDWDMFYLGGQLLYYKIHPPIAVTPTHFKVWNVNRLHAYGIRQRNLGLLYNHLLNPENWSIPEMRRGQGGCDHRIGQLHHEMNVYAPRQWFFGQNGGRSDITGFRFGKIFWDWTKKHKSPIDKTV